MIFKKKGKTKSHKQAAIIFFDNLKKKVKNKSNKQAAKKSFFLKMMKKGRKLKATIKLQYKKTVDDRGRAWCKVPEERFQDFPRVGSRYLIVVQQGPAKASWDICFKEKCPN